MTYQAKLIEEGSGRIFTGHFHCFHIHIIMWQPNEDQRGLYDEADL